MVLNYILVGCPWLIFLAKLLEGRIWLDLQAVFCMVKRECYGVSHVRVVWGNLNFLLWDAAYPLGRSTPKSSPQCMFSIRPHKSCGFKANMLRNALYKYVCGTLIQAARGANAGHRWCNNWFARISIAGDQSPPFAWADYFSPLLFILSSGIEKFLTLTETNRIDNDKR